MKKFFKNQASILLFGFGIWLPLAVVIFILFFMFNNLEELGRKFLSIFLPQQYLYTGLGIVAGLLIIYVSGLILKSNTIRKAMVKIPVLGLFFGAGEIITIEQLMHLNPCIFLLSPSCPAYGWILSEEKIKINEDKVLYSLINIYYPNVPALITGQVFPVRKESVVKLGNNSKEVIDILLYAFRSPKYLRYVPWEGETDQQLETRVQSFGITEIIPVTSRD
jgi:uncharacterized membrane protein